MSTFEQAGDAMLRVHDANRAMAHTLADTLRRVFSRAEPTTADDLLASPSFGQHEPDLAKELHLPGTYA